MVAVGSNVTRFKPGDKVSALYGPGAACARSNGSNDGKQRKARLRAGKILMKIGNPAVMR